MNWCIVDFDGNLGLHVTDPKEFFKPIEYINVPLSEPIELIKERTKNYKTIATIRCSFVDTSSWRVTLGDYDAVLVVDCEVVNQPLDVYMKKLSDFFENPNIFLVSSTTIPHDSHPNQKNYPWWLVQTAKLNNYTPTKLYDRPKIFDALLGLQKYHRWYVFDQLCKSQLLQKSFVSLLQFDWNTDKQSNRYFYRSPDLDKYETPEAVDAIKVYGYFDSYLPYGKNNISVQVPDKIYDNSYYSIICESQGGDWIFFTEKTAKPLLARRPFILVSAQHQLRTLREYGFKTFSQVIDESYDDEPDGTLRYQKAFDSAVALSKLDPKYVYDTLTDVLEHNYQLINNGEYFLTPVKDWLVEKLKLLG